MTDQPDTGGLGKLGLQSSEPVRRRRRGLIVLVGALVLLIGGCTAVSGYLLSLNVKLDANVRHDKTFLPPDTVDTPRPKRAQGNDALNFLFIGSDARTGENAGVATGGGRSDTIMIAHITAERDKIYLVSFPRDSYVPIPGRGRSKINAAYAFGGPALLVRTLETLTGVRIDHVAEIGFDGFRDLTDALDGVDVNVARASSVPGTPYRWSVGNNRMGGEEALTFVRQRYGLEGGDLDRVKRQQAFVKGVMLKALSRDTLTDPRKLSKVVDAGTRYLTVDNALDTGKMRNLGISLRNVRGDDISFVTAPVVGLGRTQAGASIVQLDPDRLAQLSRDLRQDQMGNYRP